MILWAVALACHGGPTSSGGAPISLEAQVRLPPGFSISIWASDVVRPRSMTLGDDGTVYVGTFYFTKGRQSPVIALRDTDGNGTADLRNEIWRGFNTPNGVAYHDGTLYIVDEDRVLRIDDIEDTMLAPSPVEIYGGLPPRAETDLATDRVNRLRAPALARPRLS